MIRLKINRSVALFLSILTLTSMLCSCGNEATAELLQSQKSSETENQSQSEDPSKSSDNITTAEESKEMPLTPVDFHTLDKHKVETVAGSYKIDMGELVQVYFEDHPEWIELYNKSWRLHKDHIQKIPAAVNPESPFYVDEAFSGDIFLWDTVFMMLYDRYGINQFPALPSMDNFYYAQTDSDKQDNGYIPREIVEATGKDYWGGYSDPTATNPPLLSYAEWMCYQIHGDVSRFSKEIKGKTIYERLCAHYRFIENNKVDRSGLYGNTNGLGTGLDDSPNQGAGQTYNSLSMQQAQNALYLSKIAGAMGKKEDEEYYKSEHKRIAELINEKMWDEESAMYSNLASAGRIKTKISTPTALWALLAEVATEERAEKAVQNHALNSQKLFRPNGLSTLAYDHKDFVAEGGYWKGAIWAPTSYQYIKGLNTYGFDKIAFEESLRLVNTLSKVYEAGKKGGYVKSPTLYENYSAEYIRQGWASLDYELTRKDFAGWTPCMSVGLILENLAGVNINAPENNVSWDVRLTEEFSVSNLFFAHNGEENRVSLAAGRRVSAADPLTFSVKAEKPFHLTVTAAGQKAEYDIPAGTSTFRLGEKSDENRNEAKIGFSAMDFEKNKEKISVLSPIDSVYFTKEANKNITDGLSWQHGILLGKIRNLNTVGLNTEKRENLLAKTENQALREAGYADAVTLWKHYYLGGDEGFMLCAEAGRDLRTLRLCVSVSKGSCGRICAFLSDASAKEIQFCLPEGEYILDIPYVAATEGSYLFVKWTVCNEMILNSDSETEIETSSVGISLAVILGGGEFVEYTQPQVDKVKPLEDSSKVIDPALALKGTTVEKDRIEVDFGKEDILDWVQFSTDNAQFAKKKSGELIYGYKRNHDAVPSGEKGRVTDAPIFYINGEVESGRSATIDRSGVQCRGRGNGFSFFVKPTEKAQTLKLYSGTWNGDGIIELYIDGKPVYRETMSGNGMNIYETTVGFELQKGQTLEVRLTLGNPHNNGSLLLFGAAVC